MRRLHQPGPAPPDRVESFAGHCREIAFTLQPGQSLNAALTQPLVAAGMTCGSIVFDAAVLSPFSYVVPGPARDPCHVAYFSEPRSPRHARVQIANATFGWRDGAPFVHCHSAWIEPDGTRRGGHVLPHETVVASGGPARAWATADVTVVVEPDAETNFDLFHPIRAGLPTPGRSLIAARIRPNEDVGAALAMICRRHSLQRAVLRGSLGSLIGARFARGMALHDNATEVLVRHGRVTADGTAELEMLVIDTRGRVHEGLMKRGDNPVCITFEAFLQPE